MDDPNDYKYEVQHKMNMFLLGIYHENGLNLSSKNRTGIQDKAVELAKEYNEDKIKAFKEKYESLKELMDYVEGQLGDSVNFDGWLEATESIKEWKEENKSE